MKKQSGLQQPSTHREKKTTTTTIRQRQFITATPEEIYDAYLDEHKHAQFTGAVASCQRFVGGIFSAWNGYITGKNLTLENGRRIVQEWQTTEWPSGYGPSVLEFTFQRRKNGTEVRITQSKVPREQARYYQKGWTDFYWNPMKKFFRRGK